MAEVVFVPRESEEKVRFVNLTPHTLNICDVGQIESHGLARLGEQVKEVGNVNGVPLLKVGYGEPTIQLKEVSEDDLKDAIVIVSGMFNEETARKLKDRYNTRMVVAPYTGTSPEYAPQREGGRIKCIKAFRLLA